MPALESALLPEEHFDLIIDDGGHTMLQQQNTLAAYWGRLRSGGLFVVEDLHTSFNGSRTVNKKELKFNSLITLVLYATRQ